MAILLFMLQPSEQNSHFSPHTLGWDLPFHCVIIYSFLHWLQRNCLSWRQGKEQQDFLYDILLPECGLYFITTTLVLEARCHTWPLGALLNVTSHFFIDVKQGLQFFNSTQDQNPHESYTRLQFQWLKSTTYPMPEFSPKQLITKQ